MFPLNETSKSRTENVVTQVDGLTDDARKEGTADCIDDKDVSNGYRGTF